MALKSKKVEWEVMEKEKELKYNKTDDAHPSNIQAPHGIYAIVSNTISTSYYTF